MNMPERLDALKRFSDEQLIVEMQLRGFVVTNPPTAPRCSIQILGNTKVHLTTPPQE